MSTITSVDSYAKRERHGLADLLLRLGPDEPTLCAGWTTRDLAAHIVVRERRPDAGAGVILSPLRGYGERVRKAKAAEPFDAIVGQLRTPPWWSPISNPLLDELTNTNELFIHHEDVRRGRPGFEPRTLDDSEQRALWRSTRVTGRLALRRLGVPVTVRAIGIGGFTIGADPQVTISGPPSELALFLSGRQHASLVAVDGPAEQTKRLRGARLGI